MKRYLISANKATLPMLDGSGDAVSGWQVDIVDTWFDERFQIQATTKASAVGLVGAWVDARNADLTRQSIDVSTDLVTS